jgi:hypothetical protein
MLQLAQQERKRWWVQLGCAPRRMRSALLAGRDLVNKLQPDSNRHHQQGWQQSIMAHDGEYALVVGRTYEVNKHANTTPHAAGQVYVHGVGLD